MIRKAVDAGIEVIVATGAVARKIPVKGAQTAVEAVDYLLGNKTVGEKVVVVVPLMIPFCST